MISQRHKYSHYTSLSASSIITMMSPSNDQQQSLPQGYLSASAPSAPSPPLPPPPAGYPTTDTPNGTHQHHTVTRGDDFWKGCLAAICCCCVLDCCCF